MEFTWSVWLFINSIDSSITAPSSSKRYDHIFNKGNGEYDSNGIATVNNAPGLYLNTDSNNLHFVMDQINPASNTETKIVDISNIPLGKWLHLAIRLENNMLDIYVNGTISNRTIFQYVPKQNYDNINICQNTGFSGHMADLRYFARALNVFEINNIILAGPNTNPAKANPTSQTGFIYYLSNSWYPTG